MSRPPTPTQSQPFLALAGPTAVGKTALSLAIAEQLNAEIISADSRQVYKALKIGTAQPSPGELARVPHHFIGELDLDDGFSAGRFARQANARILTILHRGRMPLVVGGSTLYLQALLHGLSPVPPSDQDVRQTLEARLRSEGNFALYEELKRVDPASAGTLDPTKTQRLIRALEVYHQTGRTLSSYQAQRVPPPYRYDLKVLTMDRTHLYERINARVDRMLAAGLLDEVRRLKAHGYDTATAALRTIGYQEALAYLDQRISRSEMVRLIKRNTRRYAKRQLTWLRRYEARQWIDLDAPHLSQLGPWRPVFRRALQKD